MNIDELKAIIKNYCEESGINNINSKLIEELKECADILKNITSLDITDALTEYIDCRVNGNNKEEALNNAITMVNDRSIDYDDFSESSSPRL